MSTEFNKQLGIILKGIREDRGMSQQDVANRMGTTRVCIGHYERGRNVMSMEMLMELCDIYGIENVNEITNQLRKYKGK